MLNIGTLVGAGRWPYSHMHSNGWGTPWSGTLLARDDPRAWAGTLAFPESDPDPEAVKKHVKRCDEQLWLDTRVPVLWDFGTYSRVLWEDKESLRPYDEDVRQWHIARQLAA
jgi:hypothetical protein